MTTTGWPFVTEPDHEHVMVEIERWGTSSGEVEIRFRCRHCPKTRTTIMDRDEATR